MEIRINAPIAIVGAGTMGVGIAQVAATAGHPVTIIDTREATLDQGRAALAKTLGQLVARGRLDPRAPADIESRVRWSSDIAQAGRSALVIEAIVEKLETKRALFGALARIVTVNTILASNTSSLGIGDIATALAKPERFLGLHFFNPVPAMKLVEVVAGPKTDPSALQAVIQLMARWGKHPVQVRDVPGFIVNRVARPYYAEGFAALGEGLDPIVIDTALVEAGGFRMGPLSLADLIGHDVNYAVATSVFEAYRGETRFRPQPAQEALVSRAWLGRKSGRGVYDYAHPLPQPNRLRPAPPPARISVSDPGPLAPLVTAAARHGIVVAEDPTLAPHVIEIDKSVMALGDGRRLADRVDAEILLDHARNFAAASTLVITAKNETEGCKAAGFFQAIRRQVLEVHDRPGQLVLRTLAQLANAAADAVRDDIASADGIDEAMVYGANHPEGPLVWARRLGYEPVRLALIHLAEATSDPIYRPSPLFSAP
jgi:3-hydroxybutyryl-CoA dehydrogenase